LRRIETALGSGMDEFTAFIPYQRNDLLALWRQRGLVDDEQYEADGTRVSGRLPAALTRQFAPYAVGAEAS